MLPSSVIVKRTRDLWFCQLDVFGDIATGRLKTSSFGCDHFVHLYKDPSSKWGAIMRWFLIPAKDIEGFWNKLNETNGVPVKIKTG